MSHPSQIRELSSIYTPQLEKLHHWANILNVRVQYTIRRMKLHDENMDKHVTRSSLKDLKKNKKEIMKNVRGIYLYINRSKHTVFTFYKMSLWKTFLRKKNEFINQLSIVKDKELWNWDNEEIKYIELILKTLYKYEDYGKLVACIVNKRFCYDIAWQILDYI
tara:strand:+ start:3305 stop:3793 length:489 start_codon:yes stop_codon:yes gene_type:complete